MSEPNNVNGIIQLDNIRVLSTTYEKLLITINKEQSELLNGVVEIKTRESDDYGTSYTVVVKVASDKMCDLYKTIKRKDVVKGCYDIVVNIVNWTWLDKSGVRLDAYFIKKLEPVITVNPILLRMITPTVEQELVGKKLKIPKLVRQ
jgi:hypothetical protein